MPNPFEYYEVYGPYYHKKEKRRYINLICCGERTTMAYARYLMCIKEGRWLKPDEEVDHIDDDKMNDDIGNLQILSGFEHKNKSAKGRTFIEMICPVCDLTFLKEKRQVKDIKGGSCCSRKCARLRQSEPYLYGR